MERNTRRRPGCAAAAAIMLVLGTGVSGCTYGQVINANDGSSIGQAQIEFRQFDTSANPGGSTPGEAPLAAAITARTWATGDTGSGGVSGIYYLNPFAPRLEGDTTPVLVGTGWNRMVVSKAGFATRRTYRYHAYSPCKASTKNPISSSFYPWQGYSESDPTNKSGASCKQQDFALFPSTSNYEKKPDIIVDVRTLRDNAIGVGFAQCDNVTSRCLRVSVGTANVGDGDLWVVAPRNDLGAVRQRIFKRDNTFSETNLSVDLINHPEHGHIHYTGWTALRLRKKTDACLIETNAANCPVAREGGKQSFCLVNLYTFDSTFNAASNRTWASCSETADNGTLISQGISVGRADEYEKSLFGQLIDIAGLASGDYWLEVEVNPEQSVIETDYGNNVARVSVRL